MREDILQLELEAREFLQIGDLARAEFVLRSAVDLCGQSSNNEAWCSLIARHNLATIIEKSGRLIEAGREARRGTEDFQSADNLPQPAVLSLAELHQIVGRALYHGGDYHGAATNFERAADLLATIRDARRDRAQALSNAGLAAREAANPDRAELHLKSALDLLRDGADEPLRVRTMRFLANLHQDRGDLATAGALFCEIGELSHADPALHAETMEAVASLRERQGDPAGASAAYASALASCERAPRAARPNLAIVLVNASQHIADLGELGRSQRLLRKAARWGGRPPSHTLKIAIGAARADVAIVQRRDSRAVRILERTARDAAAAGGEDSLDALALIVMAEALRRQIGEPRWAVARLRRGLENIACAADHPNVVEARLLLAELLIDAGDNDGAEVDFRLAFRAEVVRVRPETLARLFQAASHLAAARARREASALFGKMAVAAVRAAPLEALSPLQRSAWLGRRTRPFRHLIDVLLSRDRLPEAEFVHALVQRDRQLEFASRDAALAPAEDALPFRPDEETMIEGFRVASKADRDAVDDAGRTPANLEPRRRRLERWFDEALAETWVRRSPGAPRHAEVSARPPAGMVRLRFLDRGEGRMTVALTTASDSRETQLGAAGELGRRVHQFRAAILEEADSVVALGRELFARLIEPVASDIPDGATLLLALDPPLQHLPFAALHDGDRFLIERWAPVIDTGMIAPTGNPARTHWRLGAFAATRAAHGLDELPYASSEARAIVAMRGGGLFLDEDFTARSLRDTLESGAEIVHIASHFALAPARPERSRLYLGDGSTLSLADLRRADFDFGAVQLLVLSACGTGTADTGVHGLESLAGLAQMKGARSVLATLWPVLDEASARLMSGFYGHVFDDVDQPSLAEALRRAQVAMATGSRPAAASAGTRRGLGRLAPSGKARHALRWAGFMLLGAPG